MAVGKLIPQRLMTCLTALNCFKTTRPKFTRPNAHVNIGGKSFRALIDTGSGVTLCNDTIRPLGTLPCSADTVPTLKTANGDPLKVTQCEIAPIFLPNSSIPVHQRILFVHNLQVPCLLGMDFMKKAKIIIDTGEGKIRVQPSSERNPAKKRLLFNKKSVTIQPMEEAKVMAESTSSFNIALVEGKEFTDFHVMDGLVKGGIGDEDNACNLGMLNMGKEPIVLPRGMELGSFTEVDRSEFSPISEVLQINHREMHLTNIDHVKQIKFDHLPIKYRSDYAHLLTKYADIFSRHNLDVGNSLPHVVKLTDPHKIVSVNQYRLPYHLKEVAIDYVEKLLKSGVIRPSTSVFNSPLMLVKKPNADSKKPLGEQYRLVHNYIE